MATFLRKFRWWWYFWPTCWGWGARPPPFHSTVSTSSTRITLLLYNLSLHIAPLPFYLALLPKQQEGRMWVFLLWGLTTPRRARWIPGLPGLPSNLASSSLVKTLKINMFCNKETGYLLTSRKGHGMDRNLKKLKIMHSTHFNNKNMPLISKKHLLYLPFYSYFRFPKNDINSICYGTLHD